MYYIWWDFVQRMHEYWLSTGFLVSYNKLAIYLVVCQQTPPLTPPSSHQGHAHMPRETFHLRWPYARGKAVPPPFLPPCLPPSFLPPLSLGCKLLRTYLKHMAATPATERHRGLWERQRKRKRESSGKELAKFMLYLYYMLIYTKWSKKEKVIGKNFGSPDKPVSAWWKEWRSNSF